MRPKWAEVKRRELAEHPDVFLAYEKFKRAVQAGVRTDTDRPLIIVESPDDVPLFASEDEEHEYWGTHDMGDAFFQGAAFDDDERAIIERARQRRQLRTR